MQTDIFYWIVNMSVCAAVVGSVVFLIGRIAWIPRRVLNILWAIPFLRMWIPFGIRSPYSLMWLISQFTAKTVQIRENILPVSTMNFMMQAESYFPIRYKIPAMERVFQGAAIVWMIVAGALLIAMAISYHVTKAEMKDAQCMGDNIYLSEKILSPAVYGILRAKIIVPSAWAQKDLTYIRLHENAHIRRKDNLWRVLAVTTACIHWFNPVSWWFLRLFLETLELACDEAVMTHCSQEERKAYAAALLDCAERKTVFTSAFGGASVRLRIERILSYKKLSVFSLCAIAVFAVAVGYVLLTNA